MARLIDVHTYGNRINAQGLNAEKAAQLSVLQSIDMGFIPQRVYWLWGFVEDEVRAGHRHNQTKHAMICLAGGCDVHVDNGSNQRNVTFTLNKPNQCLLLEPQDWHTMQNFQVATVLLVIASTIYQRDDYIYERYP